MPSLDQKPSKYISFIQKHSITTIIIVGIITLFSVFLLTRLELDASTSSFISQPEGSFQIPLEADPVYVSNFVVFLESDDLFNPDALTAITSAIDKTLEHYSIGSSLSAFDFVTLEKRGTRLAITPMSDHEHGTIWSTDEAEVFRTRLMNDDIARGLLVSEDGKALLINFPMMELDAGKNAEALEYFAQAWAPVEPFASVLFHGGAPIAERLSFYLSRDLSVLLVLSLLVILLVYYLSFRAKRAMFVPFSLSIIGIVWALGAMVLMGFKLTLINIITPCLVLTLGSSYSIHILTEYYSCYQLGVKNYVGVAVTRISRTIFLACLTSVIGFLSLLASTTSAFVEFGISVSVGIIICAILSVTYLPAVLTVTSAPKMKQMTHFSTGFGARIIKRISVAAVKYWKLFLIVFGCIIVGFFLVKNHIRLDANYMSYFPKNDPFIENSVYLANRMGGVNDAYITLDAPQGESGYFLQPEVISSIRNFEQRIMEESPDVRHILSFPTYISFMNKVYSGDDEIPSSPGLLLMLSRSITLISNQLSLPAITMLINPDATQMTITLRVYDSQEKDLQTIASAQRVEQTIIRLTAEMLPSAIDVHIWGEGIDAALASTSLKNDQTQSTLLSFLLVFLITLISFRSLRSGIFSLVPILVGVLENYIFMFFTKIPFDMVTIGFSCVTVGVGVDNAIHFLIRYNSIRREKPKGTSVYDILQESIEKTGKPIILSTLSIVAGMCMLIFGSYTPIRYFGILVSISLLNAMLATIFIMPACIIVYEKFIGALKRRRS